MRRAEKASRRVLPKPRTPEGPPSVGEAAAKGKKRELIGWCEWVSLPEIGISHLHAKIDTGARTSALHVKSLKEVDQAGGHPVLEVRLPIGRRSGRGKGPITRVIVEEYVTVRDSGGHAERRPVIRTLLSVGPFVGRVRITLTDRGDMLFPMLIGRTALESDFLVDPSSRHLLGKPEVKKRR
ncbi:MAG: ATP-dependent zinc protease [Deltaproteobacteria bacterium]|nr:ATP-dependent zinc protease [Deltaproteobacteria bacterium]